MRKQPVGEKAADGLLLVAVVEQDEDKAPRPQPEKVVKEEQAILSARYYSGNRLRQYGNNRKVAPIRGIEGSGRKGIEQTLLRIERGHEGHHPQRVRLRKSTLVNHRSAR